MDIILCTKEQADNYFMHYGVPGMKKGVLRWTNKDGTLTEAGKRHYGIGDGNTRSAPKQPKFTFSAHKSSSKSGESRGHTPKFTFSARKSSSEQPAERSSQNARNFPSHGRKTNVTGKAKYATTGDAVATNGPVSGQMNDSVQYETYINYLKALLPAAMKAQQNGTDLSKFEEQVDSVPGKFAKQFLLESGILPKEVVDLFPDDVLQFFYNRWMANPNSKFSEFVAERAAASFKKKK